ncbi:hypothetical protein GGX14DRAFT_577061 [Mycena pura]|uniref:Uncharacterized protein n=1 Tax=Mycena pura TaxID=153505 RepID=A0AAD6UZE2_9AGAR|nr:hypothetical protein GGX14DRAFT_577061 [Mycena pura]
MCAVQGGASARCSIQTPRPESRLLRAAYALCRMPHCAPVYAVNEKNASRRDNRCRGGRPADADGYELVFGPTASDGANNAPCLVDVIGSVGEVARKSLDAALQLIQLLGIYMGFLCVDGYNISACPEFCNTRGPDPIGDICQNFSIWKAQVNGMATTYYHVAEESTAVNFGVARQGG